MQTIEQLAPTAIAETIATITELIPKLTRLTTEQPTTAEIEEALLACKALTAASKALTQATFEWLANRYCIQAAARKAYGLGQQALTPLERPA